MAVRLEPNRMAIKLSSPDHQTFDAVPLDTHRIGLAQFVLCRMDISEEKVALFALNVPKTRSRFLVILFYTMWQRRRFLDEESSLRHACCHADKPGRKLCFHFSFVTLLLFFVFVCDFTFSILTTTLHWR